MGARKFNKGTVTPAESGRRRLTPSPYSSAASARRNGHRNLESTRNNKGRLKPEISVTSNGARRTGLGSTQPAFKSMSLRTSGDINQTTNVNVRYPVCERKYSAKPMNTAATG